jgi:hypothetical protein
VNPFAILTTFRRTGVVYQQENVFRAGTLLHVTLRSKRLRYSRTAVATLRVERGFVGTGRSWGVNMHKFIIAFFMAAALSALPGVGTAKGCLKGAAVGGVVGHVAGHHAVAGAAAGCIIEHHREKVRDKAAARQQNAPQDAAGAGRTATTPPRQ